MAGSALNNNGVNALSIFLAANATANIEGNMSFSVGAHRMDAADANAITFNKPSLFTQDAGCSGNVFTATGTSNAIVFNAGATFIQKSGANPFGLIQPASKVLFKTGSLFKVQQILFLSLSGRTYADLEIDFPAFNQSVIGVNPLNIDNLTITQGTLSLNLTDGINIKGNVAVAAGHALNFNPATTGMLSFNGTSPQIITNSGTLNFNNNQALTINNTAGIEINSDIIFNNQVSFTSGIVTVADPAILTLSATASVTGVSNISFVNGLVKKTGNSAFTFPVGATGIGYVPISITAPGSSTDEYVAAYKRSGAVSLSNNYAAGLDHVSGIDYWILNRTNGTTPVDITLYWTTQSSLSGSALYINDLSKLVIAHYNGSNQWDTYGGTFNSGSGFAAGSITWPGVNNFSPFSLGSTDAANPLPVQLNYFTGVKKGDGNWFNWNVSCTVNANTVMNLERSTDGNNFTGISGITATALRCLQPFDFNEKHPLPGINYYRLKITDANGLTTYSNTILLPGKENDPGIVLLSSTPANTNAILSIAAAQKTTMKIVVTDISGRRVTETTANLTAGNNRVTVNLSHLAKGVYQITGYANGSIKTVRFIKE